SLDDAENDRGNKKGGEHDLNSAADHRQRLPISRGVADPDCGVKPGLDCSRLVALCCQSGPPLRQQRGGGEQRGRENQRPCASRRRQGANRRPEGNVLKPDLRGGPMSTTHPTNIDIAAALAEAQEFYRAHNPKSLAQYEAACAALPGGNTRSAIFVDPFPLTMAKGDGAHLWDLDGHEYVDFLSEFTAGLFGHSHPKIRGAIDAALDSGWNLGAQGAAEARFARAICDRFPSIELVRFTNSGTEANLMAVAAARA